MWELGSFCIFWVAVMVAMGQIGFVLRNRGVAGGKLGLFRIFGWSEGAPTMPGVKCVGGPPLARVLSDGGFVGTGF